MKVIILGLRRSGTTIFWQTLCQDPRFVGYNEPFNPEIRKITEPEWHARDNYKQFYDLWKNDPLFFWETYSPISLYEELQEGLSDKQIRYFQWLIKSSEHTCFDLTRCHFKISDIKKCAPDAVLVHLYRPPKSFVTSIMLPSLKPIASNKVYEKILRSKRKLKLEINKKIFWHKKKNYSAWGFEEIIGNSPDSLFGYRLKEIGLLPSEVYQLPAVQKLLAYWKLGFYKAESDGAKYFGNNYLPVNFPDFCNQPHKVVVKLYEKLNITLPDLDYSKVHLHKKPFEENSENWMHCYQKLNIDNNFL